MDGHDVQPADEELVELAVVGDRDAFGILVMRYQRRIAAFLGRFVSDFEVAQELTQETFLRAWNALERFDSRYRFSTWLFRIAHNLGVDALRRHELPTRSLESEGAEGQHLEVALPDGGKDPLERLENRELARELKREINGLRDEYRELVLLRHFAGLSYQEIAELKEMPLGTVKNKLFRAHSVLRKALAGHMGSAG